MCESGSTDRAMSSERIGSALVIESTFDANASCVSMTPLGSPVVPDV